MLQDILYKDLLDIDGIRNYCSW